MLRVGNDLRKSTWMPLYPGYEHTVKLSPVQYESTENFKRLPVEVGPPPPKLTT